MKKIMLLSIFIVLLSVVSALAAENPDNVGADEIERRGAHVMPFDLDKTTHIFTKTEKGGLQQVIAKENTDAGQIGLIQAHLFEISREFSQGDFSDPISIHGEDMPGLNELRKADPGSITIEYMELPRGAQIKYSTDNPLLVNALHQWFDAQLREHSRHAVPDSNHHPPHSP